MLYRVKSYLHRAYQRQKSYRQGRRRTVYEIVPNAEGAKVSWLTLENEKGERVIKSRQVVLAEAFKRDLFSVDLICLSLSLADDRAVEINEEMLGWESLIKRLPEYLPGCQKFEEWFETVAFPAFQPNITEIYRRVQIES